VEVIVEAGCGRHEQGGRHPVQAQGAGQLVGKQALQKVDGLLGLIDGQQRGISLGQGDFSHIQTLLVISCHWNQAAFSSGTGPPAGTCEGRGAPGGRPGSSIDSIIQNPRRKRNGGAGIFSPSPVFSCQSPVPRV